MLSLEIFDFIFLLIILWENRGKFFVNIARQQLLARFALQHTVGINAYVQLLIQPNTGIYLV